MRTIQRSPTRSDHCIWLRRVYRGHSVLTITSRIFHKSRPLANAVMNEAQRKYKEHGAYNAAVQFEPNRGFVVVLFCKVNIPEAWEEGIEVQQPAILPTRPDPTWRPGTGATKSTPTTSTGSTGSTVPTRGAKAQIWKVADSLLESVGYDRDLIVETCVEMGIKKGTVTAQLSNWRRARNITS